MKRQTIGRGLVAFVAIFWAVGAIWADFNETHVFNPSWLVHARFHAAFDLLYTVCVAVIAIRLIWSPMLAYGALLTSLYPAAFFMTALVPGVAFADPDRPVPTVWGVPIQLVAAGVTLCLVAGGYQLARSTDSRPPV